MGDSAPILPTIPSASASPLCTAPITVAQPKRGTSTAATTRNISENEVPMPPGMCRESVMTLANGPITFLANSPRSQHKARKIMVLRRDDFIRKTPLACSLSKIKARLSEKKNTQMRDTLPSKVPARLLLKHGKLPRFQGNSAGSIPRGRRIIDKSLDPAARKRLHDSIIHPCGSVVILS